MSEIELYLDFKKAWYKLAPFTKVIQTKVYSTKTITLRVIFYLNGEVEEVKQTITSEQIHADQDLLNNLLKTLYLDLLDKITTSVIQ